MKIVTSDVAIFNFRMWQFSDVANVECGNVECGNVECGVKDEIQCSGLSGHVHPYSDDVATSNVATSNVATSGCGNAE